MNLYVNTFFKGRLDTLGAAMADVVAGKPIKIYIVHYQWSDA